VRGTYQVLLDAQGQPVKLLVDQHWTGTGTANGNYVIERAAQNDIVDLVTRRNSTAGQIHDQVRSLGLNRDLGKKGDRT
jgi:hypothetical protein